jgi:hypothetical protein
LAKDDSEAQMHNADAGIGGGTGSLFPLLTEIGEKTIASAGAFIQESVTAITVVSNGRGDQQRGRGVSQGEKGSDQASR